MTNMQWLASGETGCTFCTLFARNPEKVGWKTIKHTQFGIGMSDALIISIEFPKDWTARMVYDWTGNKSFFSTVETSEDTIGLRGRINGKDTWVQYFGPDSHVPTRQTPVPMLMYTRNLNPLGYYKQVGFTGILHLAHAFSQHLTEKMVDTLWGRSYEQVKKKIGHTPTIKEAAKTTWLKKDVL